MRQTKSMPDTCIVPACENPLTVYIKNTHNMCEGCNANWKQHSEKGGNLEDFLSYRSNFKQAPEFWKNSPIIFCLKKSKSKREKRQCVLLAIDIPELLTNQENYAPTVPTSKFI